MKKYFAFLLVFVLLGCFVIAKKPFKIFPVNSKINFNEDTIVYKITGQIISKNNTILKIKIDTFSKPFKTNQIALLSKFFENDIGKVHLTGWLDIANIKIISIKNNLLSVNIEKELSVTYINGEKKNHFKAGTLVKRTWKEPE